VNDLTARVLRETTAELWASCVRHVEELEDIFIEKEKIMERVQGDPDFRFVISTESSDEDSDSEEDSSDGTEDSDDEAIEMSEYPQANDSEDELLDV